jgi:hypothetical protein
MPGFNFPLMSCITCHFATQIVQYSTFSGCFWTIIICTGEGCLKIIITSVLSTLISIPQQFPISFRRISLDLYHRSFLSPQHKVICIFHSANYFPHPYFEVSKAFNSILSKVVGPADRPARPWTQHDYHHDTKVKPEAATAVIELLIKGKKTPETCWALNKHQDNKRKICCIRLVIYLN